MDALLEGFNDDFISPALPDTSPPFLGPWRALVGLIILSLPVSWQLFLRWLYLTSSSPIQLPPFLRPALDSKLESLENMVGLMILPVKSFADSSWVWRSYQLSQTVPLSEALTWRALRIWLMSDDSVCLPVSCYVTPSVPGCYGQRCVACVA